MLAYLSQIFNLKVHSLLVLGLKFSDRKTKMEQKLSFLQLYFLLPRCKYFRFCREACFRPTIDPISSVSVCVCVCVGVCVCVCVCLSAQMKYREILLILIKKSGTSQDRSLSLYEEGKYFSNRATKLFTTNFTAPIAIIYLLSRYI